MAFQFVGNPDVQHVPQPEGTEMCFAAIVSAVTDEGLSVADEALKTHGLYDDEGRVLPMGDTQLDVGQSVLDIKTVLDPFGAVDSAAAAMERIDEDLVAARAVALLYKKTHDPANDEHHWALLTGYFRLDGTKGAMKVMDPLRGHMNYVRHELIEEMIRRSMDFRGAYAYSLSARASTRQTAPANRG